MFTVGEIEVALDMPDKDFTNKYGIAKPLQTGENMVIYCRSGRRSLEAITLARKMGFTE